MSCNENLNTKIESCGDIMSVGVKLFLVHKVASDGTDNSIRISTTIDEAFVTAKINNADKTKRWYPIGKFEEITDLRGDNVFETFASGRKNKVRDAVAEFNGSIDMASPLIHGVLKSFEKIGIAAYVVDSNGNLHYELKNSRMYPIAIEKGSMDAKYVKATDTTNPREMVKFDWSLTVKDENLRMVTPDDDINLLEVEGLVDVKAVASSPAATSVRVTLTTSTLLGDIPVVGFVAADFVLNNVTDASPISILTAVETDPGVSGIYDITYAAQTVADVIAVTSDKEGYEITRITYIVA